jgi:hypothetical protein
MFIALLVPLALKALQFLKLQILYYLVLVLNYGSISLLCGVNFQVFEFEFENIVYFIQMHMNHLLFVAV